MKIHLASDLHLEHLVRWHPEEFLVDKNVQADVMVLAGDIHNGAMAVEKFKDWDKPIVMVAGNHEGFGYDWNHVRQDLAHLSRGTNIHFLDDSAVVIGGVRFLGATLWTDFMVDGLTQKQGLRKLDTALKDFRLISIDGKRFSTKKALEQHEASVKWLDAALSEPFDGRTVVVTHHGPHIKSVDPKWMDMKINGGFVSDLTPLLAKTKTWLHGHVHNNADYLESGCRVVANPHGYVRNLSLALTAADFKLENPHFNPALVLEV